MKKTIFFLFIIFLTGYLGAFENMILKVSFPNAGFGLNTPEAGAFELNPVIIGVEHRQTRIGLEYSIGTLWYHTDEDQTFKPSLLNFNLYYNIFDFNLKKNVDHHFYFGVFNKISTMFIESNGPNWDDFVYTAGIRAGINYSVVDFINWHVIGTELGYRNINSKNTFYVGVNLDIIGTLLFVVTKKN